MKHGGDIYTMAKKLHCQSEEIIDFSSNINTVVPTVGLPLSHNLITAYGDPHYRSLKQTIAHKYSLKPANIALFNGASSAILELFKMLSPQTTYLYAPLYGEYLKAAQHYSHKTKLINRFKHLDILPEKGSTVVFVNPTTPDGKYYDLETLFKIWKAQKCTVVVDESFLEFSEKPSLRQQIYRYKKLYIIHSFTKFYACAGLRVGAVFSHKKQIERFVQPAWPVSSFDAAYLERILQLPQHESLSIQKQRSHSKILRSILKKSGLFDKIYPNDANFILTRSKKAKKIYKALYQQKILVRDCDNFKKLPNNHLRFAVKDKKALTALQKALHALT